MAFSPQATPAPAPHQASGAEAVLRSMMEQMVQAAVEREFERFEGRHPALAEWLEETAHETLGCYTLKVPSHRRRLRTMNGIEQDHAEMRRRTRVVRIFPNEASLLRLASALAAERNEQWMERR
jgi:putative transposase